MYHKYGFASKPAATKKAPLPVSRNALPFVQRGRAVGYRMGNVGDYINSSGFPGSSTMWLYGMGEETDSGFSFSSLIKGGTDLINSIATTGLPAYMQYEIYKANLERAKQSLPPLDPYTYAPSLRVGADQATLNTARIGIGTVAVLGAAAIALLFLLRRR